MSVVCAAIIVSFSGIAMAQSVGVTGDPDLQSTGQGVIEREKELVPSFNELFWNDLFGVQFDSQRDSLFLKRNQDGSAEVFAVSASESGWAVSTPGGYTGHSEVLDESFVLYEENIVLETAVGVQIFDLEGLLSSFAAIIIGSNGTTWIVSGYMYAMYMDYTAPAGGVRFENSILVPMNRHMTVNEAIDSIGEYSAQGRADVSTTTCADTWRACDDQAYADYQTGLGIADATAPFYSGQGAAAGGGIGGVIGFLFGFPGAGVGTVIGGTLGALGGGIAAAHYEHSSMRYAET